MGKRSKKEYFRAIYRRYRKAGAEEKGQILDEFCKVCGYNRKYAIGKLNRAAPEKGPEQRRKRKRGFTYSEEIIRVLSSVWEASGFVCSVAIKSYAWFVARADPEYVHLMPEVSS